MNRDPIIPFFLEQIIADCYGDMGIIPTPLTRKEEAGAMFTDICGFTKITEMVSSHGHYGVEIITEILNIYFDCMISKFNDYGGSLVKFGGDALFAIFPGRKDEVIPKMLSCRDAMYEAMIPLNIQFQKKYGIEINFNGSINWGEISLNVVGQANYHYDYYVDGDAVKELFVIGNQVKDCSLALSSEVESYSDKRGEKVSIETAVSNSQVGTQFLPNKVAQKMQEKDFSAELRNSAIMFVKLTSKSNDEKISYLDYHRFYVEIQRIVYNLDGTINKIDYTDKGHLILITFGTPYNHLNDIERAVTCCYRLQRIPSSSIRVKIGLTYSNIFAGILGAKNRYEYGIIGNAVNIAARLMSNSREGEISFSEDILNNVNNRFETKFVEEVFVKGIKEPIRIHTIVNELPSFWSVLANKYEDKKLIAYQEEIEEIEQILENKEKSVILISGDGGTGKSFIAYWVMKKFVDKHKSISVFVLEEFNRNNQCEWYLNLLNKKLNIDNPVTDFHLVKAYCDNETLNFDSRLLLKYFEAIYDEGIELSNDEIDIIYSNHSDILSRMLADDELLFIDNLQNLDLSSYQILIRSIPKLLERELAIIFSIREDKKTIQDEIFKSAYHLELTNLPQDKASVMIRDEIPSISNEAIDGIIKNTEGNPLFISEMCSIIRRNSDASQSILGKSDLKRLEKEGIISDRIENLLINEFENLDEEFKNVLKTASVVGKAFSMEEIGILSDQSITEYYEIIDRLNQNKYIGKKDFNPGIEYIFSNRLMRDAIYRTILLSQKRELHNKIGNYYETRYNDNIKPYLELIANHFIYADNRPKAADYCKLAGDKTSRIAAYAESNYYYEYALGFTDSEQEKYKILLSMIKNYILQGDANKADSLIESVVSSYSDQIDDAFHLLTVRTLLLKGAYHELSKLTPVILTKIRSESHKDRINSHYLDVLQYLNQLDEFEKLSRELKARIEITDDIDLKANYLISNALHRMNRAEYKAAESFYVQLKSLADKSGNLIHQRIALNGLGIAASRMGNKELARKYILEGLEICEKLGDRNGYSKLIMDLGTLYLNNGQLAEAINTFEKSLSIAKLIGNVNQQNNSIYNIGVAYYHSSQFDKALTYLKQSLQISNSIGDLIGVSYCNDAIGDILFTEGKFDEASRTYKANLKLQRKLKDKEGIAHTLGNLGNLEKARKNYSEAKNFYKEQINISQVVGDKDGAGRAYFNWGTVELEENKYETARQYYLQALKLFQECDAKIYIEMTEKQLEELDKLA